MQALLFANSDSVISSVENTAPFIPEWRAPKSSGARGGFIDDPPAGAETLSPSQSAARECDRKSRNGRPAKKRRAAGLTLGRLSTDQELGCKKASLFSGIY